jgi:1-acyl-sn-glycerol-3-phosphate acyltransferase
MPVAANVTPAFRAVMVAASPAVRGWGRLEVAGLTELPSSGPVLLAGNHDSWWDPVVIGIAALQRRQVQALAKSSLWKNAAIAKVLDGMGQIPIDRGRGDAGALERAISELRQGACIGIFLEGTRSHGRVLRARSGLGRIAQDVPEAQIVCCTVEGTVDMVRFPKRPRLRVRFFAPARGRLAAGESAADLTARLLAEIRCAAPVREHGRRRGR